MNIDLKIAAAITAYGQACFAAGVATHNPELMAAARKDREARFDELLDLMQPKQLLPSQRETLKTISAFGKLEYQPYILETENLIHAGLVQRSGNGCYRLTDKGRALI